MVLDCFQCGSFDLCDECYLLGKRCEGGHTLVSAVCAIDTSECSGYIRDCQGGKDSVPRICASCKSPANQGIFYRMSLLLPVIVLNCVPEWLPRTYIYSYILHADCCACEDKAGLNHYNLCHACYSSGSRCKNPGQHILLLDIMSSGHYGTKYPSTCKRKWSSTHSFKKGGSCTRCRAYIREGSFFREFLFFYDVSYLRLVLLISTSALRLLPMPRGWPRWFWPLYALLSRWETLLQRQSSTDTTPYRVIGAGEYVRLRKSKYLHPSRVNLRLVQNF